MVTINLSNTVTQEAFGEMVGISQQTASELLTREVLVQGGSAGEWLRSYTSHLREMAAGRAASGDLDLSGERARNTVAGMSLNDIINPALSDDVNDILKPTAGAMKDD